VEAETATEKPQGDAAVPRWIVMPSPQELVDTVPGRCLTGLLDPLIGDS
jgi:hypothetical protein